MTIDEIRMAVAECLGAEWRLTPKNGFRMLVFPCLYAPVGECTLERSKGDEKMVNLNYMWREGHILDYTGNAQYVTDVIESARAMGWTCLLANGLDGTWECTFIREKPDATVYAPGDTLPLAVCTAFLKIHDRIAEDA